MDFWKGPNLPALVITIIVACVAALFATSYSLAMGDPQPHDVPIGFVSQANDDKLGAALSSSGTTFKVIRFGTVADAREAITEQSVYGALVDEPAGKSRLFISSASGASVARILQAEAPHLQASLKRAIVVDDLHPLPPTDPSGLVLFYVSLAAVIVGFVGAIQTRVNAARLTLRGELGWDIARSVVGGFSIVLATSVICRIVPFPFLPVWGVLALTMLIAGMTYSFFRVILGGRWALLPTWLVFVVVSNPSSGGAVAPALLPPFYEFMGRWLPTGAAVRAIRDLTYFPRYLHPEPYIVLVIWLVITSALFIGARLFRYGPGVPGDILHSWRFLAARDQSVAR